MYGEFGEAIEVNGFETYYRILYEQHRERIKRCI
ncbi:hypothetical protein BCL52_0898 [Salisediminibacterium halotolerans]|nr:hypothetical protein BCL39_0900 [Actinophytocola xinjiangensis]RPE89240.1 hypothetical protein EDD67_0013 [Salisediminibacterium halotolerans]TWG35999.1 hypothetical protein BCL52_0898 [Salisediminibacterium halotolerans]